VAGPLRNITFAPAMLRSTRSRLQKLPGKDGQGIDDRGRCRKQISISKDDYQCFSAEFEA
jgi:hypothetical protein